MAISAGEELQRRRVARKMTRAQVAEACHCSIDVIDRLESGETKEPHPDLIDAYGRAVGDPFLWNAWMCKQYGSYARHHGNLKCCTMQGAMLAMEAEIRDLICEERMQELRRDLVDGSLDSPVLRDWLVREGMEALDALGAVIAWAMQDMEGRVRRGAAGGN